MQELQLHQQAQIPCEPRIRPPTEGFSLEVESRLRRRRKLSATVKVEDIWGDVYKILFPGEKVPSPCV